MNDIDLTAIMQRDGIKKIERFRGDWFLVVLFDGRMASGNSVGEALSKALAGDAERLAA